MMMMSYCETEDLDENDSCDENIKAERCLPNPPHANRENDAYNTTCCILQTTQLIANANSTKAAANCSAID